MPLQRISAAFPYAVMLALAAWFYHLAVNIEYTQRGDYLGPDFWPRLALGFMMVICTVQIARLVISGRADDAPVIDASEDEPDEPRSNVLLAIGLILTLAYGALVTILGFFLATLAFMVLFIYAGRYRRHRVVWLSSIIGTVIALIAFQRVVYVSLPRGVPPFDQVADLLLSLF
mgnify:CR=1 FL=1